MLAGVLKEREKLSEVKKVIAALRTTIRKTQEEKKKVTPVNSGLRYSICTLMLRVAAVPE
jgi:hypothetical protein